MKRWPIDIGPIRPDG